MVPRKRQQGTLRSMLYGVVAAICRGGNSALTEVPQDSRAAIF